MESGAHGAPSNPCVYKHVPQSRRDMSQPLAHLVMSYSARIKILLAPVLDFRFINVFHERWLWLLVVSLLFASSPGGKGSCPGESRAIGLFLSLGKHSTLHSAKPSGGFGHRLPQCGLCPVFLKLMIDDGQGARAFLLRPWQALGSQGWPTDLRRPLRVCAF